MWEHMLKDTKAVLFDLDGTLIDSMSIWKKIDYEFLSGFGIELPDGLQNDIEGLNYSDMAEYFQTRFNLPISKKEIMKTWDLMSYEWYEKKLPLKPGVKQLLNQLASLGIKMGIGTSNSRQLTELVLNNNQVFSLFDIIVTADEERASKPRPDVYLKAASHLGVQPKECLVFEDIPAGIMAGKNAGMRVCAVEDSYSAHLREEKMALADFYMEQFSEFV